MTATPRVFISYARADDEAFVKRLHGDLTKHGIDVWWDRESMESRGQTFLQVIRDAISRVDCVLLVVGPKAATSDYVRVEWEYALSIGIAVIPLLRVGNDSKNDNDDYGLIPRELKNLHAFDVRPRNKGLLDRIFFRSESQYRNELRKLIQEIPRISKPGKLHDVPPLPLQYLPRPEELAPLFELVLADVHSPTVITSAQQTASLRGMGGVGKTILAIAFARDYRVRRVFQDGVLWVTLGKTPNIVRVLQGIGQMLGQNLNQYNNPDELRRELGNILEEKICLIILDDIWNSSHVEDIRLALGTRCRILITTRDGGLSTALGAQEHKVGILSDQQASELLAQWTDYPVSELPTEASEIIRECGHLPLALAMVGAMVRNKPEDRWRYVLKNLQQANLDKIKQDFAGYEYVDVLRAIQVSVEELEPQIQQRYFDLAVFPEDTPIDESTLALLWRINAEQVSETVDLYIERSLAQRRGNGLTLHDLQFDYVRNAETRQQIGSSALPALHEHLVQLWGNPYELPDNYAWNHYAYHLHGAGRDDDLLALFTDQRWMNARFEHDGYTYTGYNADLMLAWERAANGKARAQLAAGQSMTALPTCVLLALIRTSINSLAGNYVPEVVTQAVTTGVWTTTRALGISRNIPNAQQRAEMYISLLGTSLSEQERKQASQQALAAAQAIQPEGSRASVLSDLADKLDEEQRTAVMSEALAAAQAIQDEQARARALSTLAGKLDEEQRTAVMSEALAAAQAIQDEQARASVLSNLADKLAGEQRAAVLSEALATAMAIRIEGSRINVLSDLADKLDEVLRTEVMREALAAAQAIQDKWYRARVLSDLIDKLDEGQRTEVMREALAAAQVIRDEGKRAKVLSTLADKLDPADTAGVGEVLAAAQAIQDEGAHAKVLGALVDKLDERQRTIVMSEALAATQAIQDEGERAKVLSTLADKLDPADTAGVGEALAAAQAIQDEWYRAKVLSTLADKLDPADTVGVSDVLAAAQAIQSEWYRAKVLSTLADKLDPADTVGVGKALAAAQTFQDKRYRARMLSDLVSKLDEGQQTVVMREALAAAQTIQDERYRAGVLSALADKLDEGQRTVVMSEALAAARAIQYEWYRATTLSVLVNKLDERQRTVVMSEALAAAQAIQDEKYRAKVLSDLADKLDPADTAGVGKALAAAQTFQDKRYRARVLSALTNKLDEEQRTVLVNEALAAAQAIQDLEYRASVLSALTDKLDARQRTVVVSEALAAAQAIQGEKYHASVLSDLVDKLDEEQRTVVMREALAAAQAIQDEKYRAGVLSVLADKLDPANTAGVGEALAAAQAIQDDGSRARVLSALADKLNPADTAGVGEALAAAQAIQDEKERARVLSDLVDKLDAGQRTVVVSEALAAAQAIRDKWYRARVLSALANKLDEEQRLELFLENLQGFQGAPRWVVLEFCKQPAWLPSEHVSTDTVFQITRYIQEICTEWVWM
jgi:hypothetical protein